MKCFLQSRDTYFQDHTLQTRCVVYTSLISDVYGRNHERLVNSNADFEDIWNNRTTWLTPISEIDDDDDISKVAHLGYD